MLRMFGAHDVAILDGGIAKWKSEGRPLAQGKQSLRHRHFTVWQDDRNLRTKAQILANLHTRDEQVLDARGAARWSGEEADPRPNIARGHIPGSINLPYTQLYNTDGTFKDKAALKAAFAEAGVDLAKPVVTTCGSGVTACVLIFGLHLAGKDDAALYDGSWSEWGNDPDTPKATKTA
jgi:thiosulfate/3-mercaptopyruvate sulfurtransferase